MNIDWTNKNFKYEQDHLHLDNRFNDSKLIAVSMEDWKRWHGMRIDYLIYICLKVEVTVAKMICHLLIITMI